MLQRRYAFSKLWILVDCAELKPAYFTLYNEQKLYMTTGQSVPLKIFLLICSLRLFFLARLLVNIKRAHRQKHLA